MQLVALNDDKRIIAEQAIKKMDYRCLECLNQVRLRSGPHRQPHFFHITSHPLCKQQGKTLCHLHAQLHILKTLPQVEADLEVAFPQIGRIADVVWETKRLIFEVQCSPISAQEVKERILDYESLGYQVIWILHEKRFNRHLLSAAEQFLAEKECYFTSINEKGNGMIYDQVYRYPQGEAIFPRTKSQDLLIKSLSLKGFFLERGRPQRTSLPSKDKTHWIPRRSIRSDAKSRSQRLDECKTLGAPL